MKVQDLNADEVVINPALAARKGEPDDEDVKQIAMSYQHRAENGLEPIQIKPAIVRAVNGHFELVDGRHRLEAVKLVNESGGLNGETLPFAAVVVRADDEAGLITAVQANFNIATNNFDRADAMARLLEMDGKKTQAEVASIFGVSEGTVSQLLKLNKLEKKYIKAVKAGDLEPDAAIWIANLEGDDAKKAEIFEEAIRHKNKSTEIMARLEHKKAKEEVQSEIEAAKAKADELAAKAKEVEKQARELEKAAAKTKDEKELADVRKQADAIAKEKKTVGKQWAQAQKDLEKAKERKEKLAAQPATAKKSKVTVEDAKAAAKETGENVGPTPHTKNQFVVALEAMGENEKRPLPKGALNLIGKIEAYLDGDISETQLENSFRANCNG